MGLYYGPRRAEGERHALEAVRIARRLEEPELLVRTLNNYLLAAWVPDRNAERLRAAEEMPALPELPRVAELAARLGRTSRAREHACAAVRTHRRLGLAYLEEQSRALLSRLE